MALTLGTNCYLLLADAEIYFADRLDSAEWVDAVTQNKQNALVTATRIIDNEYRFIGQAISTSQSLAWPRTGVTYMDPRLNQIVTVASDEYPKRLKDATCEQAYHLLVNENLLDETQQTFESITVGPISISDSSSDYKAAPRINPSVKSILLPLLLRSSQNRGWAWR